MSLLYLVLYDVWFILLTLDVVVTLVCVSSEY